MKLHDRCLVEGSNPPIYIGHREFKDKRTGEMRRCRKWHGEYNHQGKKFDESLKTSNKAHAIREAHKILERLERGEVRQVQRRTEWQEMYEGYIAFLRSKGRSPKTIEKYELVLTAFMDFAKERKRVRPEAISPADFWAFNEFMTKNRACKPRAGMSKTGLHDKTRADRLTIVKQWFKWAVMKAKPPMLMINLLVGEEIEEAESSPQPCFTPEQMAQLLDKADKNHEGPIYAIMAYLGLRFGEVRDLKWSDFDFGHGAYGWVTIQRGGANNKTKGKASRRIPINEALRKVLDGLPRGDSGRIFFQRPSEKYPNGDKELSERRLLLSLKRLCKRCGFANPNQYKLHTFRHAFASMLARNNFSYKYALEFMGHKDSKILDLYYKMFDKTAETAMASIKYDDTGSAA